MTTVEVDPAVDRSLRRFQAATGVSAFGSRVSELALPLAALLLLEASPVQIGVLASATLVPHLVIGLPAGTWCERLAPRRLMLWCDGLRLVLMSTIPLAYVLGVLSFPQLVVIAAAVGVLTVFSDLATSSYLPRLVGIDRLVEARSRQVMFLQLADVIGRPLGGLLVGVAGAARAMTADALSYAFSFAMVWGLPEMEPADRSTDAGFWRRLRAGATFAWRNRVNRSVALEAGHYNLFYQAFVVVFVYYSTTVLHWSGAAIGLALGASSLGAIAGASVAPRISERFGIGPSIVGALLVADAATLIVPLAIGAETAHIAVVCATFVVIGAGSLVSGVLAGSLNRAVTPEDVYSRVLGANRVLTRGGSALGGLVGGLLLTTLSPRGALVVCALGMCTAVAWVANRHVSRVRTVQDAMPAR